ncbi:YeeE/YedE thiosulfate transporter family protein, partial [Morganella morganii]|uniref:YeeE/YedE thiosulfate transporter family protein n=1 Tax=Morganella morganii TaxID=582 RepID=UPI001FFCA100
PGGTFPCLATLAGGLLFGIGMAFAGSCSTGVYYRAAEGLAGRITAVGGLIISSWFIRQSALQQFFSPVTTPKLDAPTITQSLNIPP